MAEYDNTGDQEDDEFEPLTWRDRTYNWFQRVSFLVYSIIIVVLLALGMLWPRVFIVVESGHHAVKYEPLGGGTVTNPEHLYGEGIHVIVPWDSLYIYETRLQQRFLEFNMLSDEGLSLEIVISVRYRPERDMLGFLHQDIGTEYYERLIRPQLEAHVRETLGHRPAHEIYSSAGDLVQELNHVTTLTRIGDATKPYVIVQEVKLVNVDLPDIVDQAIADRYRQEQLRLEYDDRLLREEKEAERKRIEAKGIADYNDIIGPDSLRWRDIEAVKALAESPNAKIIMLGGGGTSQDGQPPLMFSLSTAPEQDQTPVVVQPNSATPAP
ncbi:prohibitin family protein [Enhygromyxa salina]|uniref:SPFH domain / Band 7 family protein n=1 Tax=Enhygromyxa salina TaxID=215803 RepID=A0A2S9YTW1_9BACT|nr:prohibitin family protein [Enhygromyxa salina]PRQ08472.1 SPFH domain / Band 7 family protein [Enhygromyxa salina]